MTQPDKLQRLSTDSVESRWLRQRDEARDAGDRLGTAVRDFLRGDLDQEGLKEALERYAEDEGWGGSAMSFIIRGKHKSKKPGDVDVVSANREND